MADALVFTNGINARPAGFKRITNLSAAVTLTGSNAPSLPPANAAKIQALLQDVSWQDNGTTVTATNGNVLKAGETLDYVGDLNKLQLIEIASGAEIRVAFAFLSDN
jgi:hypothetical protein